MTTNDTKALVKELQELRSLVKENTNTLRLLVKIAKAKPAASLPVHPARDADE